MEKDHYEFVSSIMVDLFNETSLFTYDFLTKELHISRTGLSEMKQGKDMYIHRYLVVINYMMEMLDLKVNMSQLAKELRVALCDRCDLVIGVVPHDRNKVCIPKEWVTVLEWGTLKYDVENIKAE